MRCFYQIDERLPTSPHHYNKLMFGSYGRGVITFDEGGTEDAHVHFVISAEGTELTMYSGQLVVHGRAQQSVCE